MHTAVLISSGNDIHKWIFYDVNLFTMGSRIQNCPIYEVTGLFVLFCHLQVWQNFSKIKIKILKKHPFAKLKLFPSDNSRHFKSKQVSQKLKEIRKTCKNKSTALFDNSSFSTMEKTLYIKCSDRLSVFFKHCQYLHFVFSHQKLLSSRHFSMQKKTKCK